VTARDEQGAFLIRELQRLRLRVRHVWPSNDPIPSDADVIYCDYDASLSRRVPWASGEARVALVAILPQTDPISPDMLEAVTPDAVLARPFTVNAILASFVVARSQFLYQRRLRAKVDRLEETLRAMRTIERAKVILMDARSMDADQAYAFMRAQAMARRMQIGTFAAGIVASTEFLGPDRS